MKNVLVTGGAGFIGSNFIHYLLENEKEARVFNFDALTYAGNLDSLADVADDPRYQFIQGNICDAGQVDAAMRLLDAARKYWLEEQAFPVENVRFHHVSTDEVFGSLKPGEPAWTEETPYAPNSPYAASKAGSDHLVRSYGHTYGLPYTITNCSNNYGPYQFPEKLIPLIILNAMQGKPLPVYGDGGQIRDWLHVEDHCEAIHLVLTKGATGSTYNIGGENQPANLTIVETICDILDEIDSSPEHRPHRNLIQFVKDRPGHDRRYDMDTTKIRNELGWRPRHNLNQGLLGTVNWYLSHPEWVESIRRRQEYQGWLDKNYTAR
ncbi:MAG: dTDP-glucose 4,6-dehydratase [Chloroflexi bacterium]|nr:dTDP-glucose 4,6-dehydratase [Chloroflexota bacterium]